MTTTTVEKGGVTDHRPQLGRAEEADRARGRATGVYRPEDVRKVLGDPREYVEVRVLSELQSASRAVRR